MNTRIYNVRILTMEEGKDIFQGEVWIQDDTITYAGSERKDGKVWDREIDGQGNLLMPGFKNAHTHSAMTFLRSASDDVPLQSWLQDSVFPMEKKLTDQDIYQMTRLAILEYLTSGITAIFDMYLRPEVTAKACQDMGMRCVLVSGLNDFTSSIAQVEEEYMHWNRKNPLISYQLGFHAEYTCDRALMVQLSGLAHRHRAPVFTHMSETMEEVRECRKKYGMTPAFFLDSLGMFDFGGGGYHCVHMTDSDMDVFRRRRMYVITNPASNAKLASGVAPIRDFIRKQIPVAIGTDGAGSNNALDMFREMFLVSGLSKLREMDAASLDALKSMPIPSAFGGTVPLSAVADVNIELAPQSIIRVNQSRQISVTGDTISGDTTAITQEIEKILAGYTLPDGYNAETSGAYEDMMDSFGDLLLALVVAMGLVYFVLASQFESFLMPVIVMMILPVAFTGALFALPLTGRDLSMISLVALIMLAGTVVNSSIILVDYIRQRREQGESRVDAILHACPLRVRPVLMTTLTTILALVPMALGLSEGAAEMMSDMSITMISGMVVSTIVTLLFTPVYYSVIDDLSHIFSRKKKKGAPPAQPPAEEAVPATAE